VGDGEEINELMYAFVLIREVKIAYKAVRPVRAYEFAASIRRTDSTKKNKV
jgi:hypothetical protein